MNVSSQTPNFGVNYDVGYIGFTSRSDDLVAAGIAWFERWDEDNQIPKSGIISCSPKAVGIGLSLGVPPGVPVGIVVEHALVVSGPDECIEAHAGTGVAKGTLSKYWKDPHCRLFFRKPFNWSRTLGEDIVISAQRRIGDKYSYGIIVADALAKTFAGRLLNLLTFNQVNLFVSRLLDRKHREVCSQLAAESMSDNMPHVGCLEEPARIIDPQELFEDPIVFEPWHNLSPIATRTE